MHRKTIAQISADLASKVYSSVELTQHFLDRIEQENKTLNAFITITKDTALAQAKAADQRLASGQAGPLTGVPIAQKDIFCTKGIKTTCGSKMLDNFIAPYDAHTVENFNRAGCVLLGKTNLDEFAMGSSGENSFYGKTLNPWHHDCVPGGSSSGSAAAVAARLTPAATGTDTGGSIRQPAALTGICGLKPTYGRVSRYGMIAFASSLDQGGLFTQTAEDCALLLNAMAGYDKRDATCVNQNVPDYTATLTNTLNGLKIGMPKEIFNQDLNPLMETALQAAIKELEALGAQFVEVSLPNIHLANSVYYIIAPAECSSNLSRYDGVRYGYRCDQPKDLMDLYKRSRSEGFGMEVKRRIMVGTYALSAGYYEAYYLKAQKVRRLICNAHQEAFKQVDLLISPTTPTTAFQFGAKQKDPLSMYLSDIYTIGTNLAGLPGLSIPCGFDKGLPIGLQLTANHFHEATLLNVAHQFQQVTDWHQKAPFDNETR